MTPTSTPRPQISPSVVRFPDEHRLPTAFGFVAVMCAEVARRRGGSASDYLQECWEFLSEVMRSELPKPSEPMPNAYDNRVGAARDTAAAMLEYDDD